MRLRPWGRTRGRGPSGEGDLTCSVSVNMLCIVGATIGIFSLFLPWIWIGEGDWQIDSSVYDTLLSPQDGRSGWWESMSEVSLIVFISGTVLAFAFPAACGVQAIGIVSFYVEHLRTDLWIGYDLGLSIGFFAAIASTALVTSSLIAPWGIRFDASQRRWPSRTWTACRAPEGCGRKAGLSLASPLDVLRALRKNRKWTAALLVTVMSMSAILYHGSRVDDAGSVEYIDGRIVISIGGSATFVHWGMTTLDASDGSETAEWSFDVSYDEYITNEWTPPTLEAKNVGELSIAPEVVDHSGEGIVTEGDRIILSPQNGTSFVSGIEYRVDIREVHYVLDVPLRHLYISFELANDCVNYELEMVQTQGMLVHTDLPFYLLAYGAVIAFVVSSMAAYRALIRGLRRTAD